MTRPSRLAAKAEIPTCVIVLRNGHCIVCLGLMFGLVRTLSFIHGVWPWLVSRESKTWAAHLMIFFISFISFLVVFFLLLFVPCAVNRDASRNPENTNLAS
jgi:hypothetical protein